MADILRRAADVLTRSGDDFFPAAVAELARILVADLVFIGEVVDSDQIRTIAVTRDGAAAENFTVPLSTSAFASLETEGTAVCTGKVREQFPEDRVLVAVAAEAMLAVRIIDANGAFLGVLAAVMARTLAPDEDSIALMQILAGRAGAELRQARSERELRGRDDHLRRVHQVEAVGRLAGGIAHDFNNLLMIMSGYAEILRERHGPSREVVELIAAAARATTLTRQLLAYGRRQVLHVERIALNGVVRQVHDLLAPVLGPGIRLETALDAELPDVDADRRQCEQMLVNLALNARDAMPGGGTLTLSTRVEQLTRPHRQMPPGTYVCLEVADTGTGMTEDVQAHIFEPFYTTKGARGSGLGLSSVYGVVKQSSGFIWCRSEPGCGTTFSIYLKPAATAALASDLEPARTSDAPAPTPARRPSVLVVDDEPSVRTWMARILRADGYEVTDTEDGRSALAMMRDAARRPGLVITDIAMPGVNGTRLAEDIERQWPATKLLFVSGFVNSAAVRAAGIVSRHAVLGKPFTPEQVLAAVRRVLNQPPPATSCVA
jgi:signal transduction histidine kinase/ActR/RegA family two-component response regulator